MASSKKGKKNKGKTLPLIDFLQETPGAVPTLPIRKSSLNWADDVDDHDLYDARSSKGVVLPTAPKASRDFDDISDNVPQNPPYMAYLSNLPYDIDENEISFFFKNLKISNMRIPKDERTGEIPKLKGYGYVEFEDRESLINALVIPDTTIKSRRIRIEVATDYDNDKRRSGRMDMSRDRNNRSDAPSGDWRSGPRTENQDSERRSFTRDKDRDDNTSGAWRDGDRRNNRDSERTFNRNPDKYGRDNKELEYSRPIEREDKPTYLTRKYDCDRGFSSRDDESNKSSESRRRPKLLLAPRTKPIENVPEKAPTSISIFGNAKPVDTSARERQIEERLAKENERPIRELSKERKNSQKDYQDTKIEKDNYPVGDKKVENEASPHDFNGVVEKINVTKKNGDQEKKEYSKGNKSNESEKSKSDKGRREEKREKGEKEMPKLKKLDPPNFIANNKFATLENEDNSD